MASGLPKESVVNVSQVFTVNTTQLDEYVETLSSKRITEILNGIQLILDPREPD